MKLPAEEVTLRIPLHGLQSLQFTISTDGQWNQAKYKASLTINTPTAEFSAQVELAASFYISTYSSFDVTKPVGRNINKRGYSASRYAGGDQDCPYLTCVCYLQDVTGYALGAAIENAQPLPLLGVLKDPIDSRKIIVANAPARTFDVPVESSGVLCFRVKA